MEKKPFITLEQAKDIIEDIPTPFHIYDERGIRENARALYKAFSWNKGYKEYFAVKATPNPFLMKILQEEGCGMDCSSYTELMLCESCGIIGSNIMFSSNVTPAEDMQKAYEIAGYDRNELERRYKQDQRKIKTTKKKQKSEKKD